MADGSVPQSARDYASTIPLDQIDVSHPELWLNNSHWPLFERLRREAPVHYCANSLFGPYWSITRFNDIMAIDTNHQVFSSEAALGGITILDQGEELRLPMFIAMDPPKHDVQRKTVSPVVSPANLQLLEPLIRERAAKILDELPRGETFDWVDRVSIELTTQMLATLFDFPFEQRRKLTYWSDIATTIPGPGMMVETEAEKLTILMECLGAFTELWNERINAPPKGDLISMLAHGEATRNMSPEEYLGNLILLIVGGNDTTRNTITGSIVALNENPDQYAKLRANPELIPSMVSETIRWQTPLAHMRRTALEDFELHGQTIKKGDKVVMWYVSGNRDEEVIENPNAYIIDRERPRQHMSFGFGIHRCVGNRLAELQLRIVWEEILKRFPVVEIMAPPERVPSPFVKGYLNLPVRIPA
ncbi:cytochrome P450 [Phenylobacterium aquaticum]|uniref:cytochrome P450 n=1 Tax=Phenylobacterium aquaticum TaxID=1763816 RepID=UPI001F5DA9C9|nr:cytochrome P450 [Phenylobacterium aquaticum]MCI3134438.1 cytochrome P450 [Phenylobacterium aquaticum]